MSDLGRLFRLRGAAHLEPRENFTTAALAIAIGYDDRPIRQALQRLEPASNDESGGSALPALKAAAAYANRVKAHTQVFLSAETLALGYLDLVLDIVDRNGVTRSLWVEVKVDAGQSGDQLATYWKYAARETPAPIVVSLARTRLSPLVASMTWSDVVSGIQSIPHPHHAWVSLLDFLLDEKIVRPTIPEHRIDAEASIEVLIGVNRKIRDRWPNIGLAWQDGALQKALKRSLDERQDLATTGGPLRYGLVAGSVGWEWMLGVATKNYWRVRLDATDMLRDAELSRLPSTWARHLDRPEVLECRLAVTDVASHDEVLTWFEDGLRELDDARILERYRSGFVTKYGRGVPAASEEAAETQTTALLKAIQFAALKHQRQRRKDSDASPYINHPIRVATLLADVGAVSDVETLMAAILHDTVEDTETTFDELRTQFGGRVSNLVGEVTDDKSQVRIPPIVISPSTPS